MTPKLDNLEAQIKRLEKDVWKLGSEASVTFNCRACGDALLFYGTPGGPYLQGVIDGLIEEHAGHDFDMIEHSRDVLDQSLVDHVQKIKAEIKAEMAKTKSRT